MAKTDPAKDMVEGGKDSAAKDMVEGGKDSSYSIKIWLKVEKTAAKYG